MNNLRKFLRFFLLLKATTVGNEFSVSGAKNPSTVIFVTRDEADNEYENFSILSSVRARKTFWRENVIAVAIRVSA